MVHMSIFAGLLLPILLYLFVLTHRHELIPQPSTPDHRVLLVRSDTIFSEGLYRLLNQQRHLILSTISPVDEMQLQEEIVSFGPNTIVLTDQVLPTIFVHLLDNLHDHASLRLIRVSIENDLVQVYEKNQVSIQQISDFASVIHGNSKQETLKRNSQFTQTSFWQREA